MKILVGRIGALGLGCGSEVVVGAEHVVAAEVEAAGAASAAGAGHHGARVFARAAGRAALLGGEGKGEGLWWWCCGGGGFAGKGEEGEEEERLV